MEAQCWGLTDSQFFPVKTLNQSHVHYGMQNYLITYGHQSIICSRPQLWAPIVPRPFHQCSMQRYSLAMTICVQEGKGRKEI